MVEECPRKCWNKRKWCDDLKQ